MVEDRRRKLLDSGRKLVKKYPYFRPFLAPGKFFLKNSNGIKPRFSGWGMTSNHELPWNDNYQGEIFRKAKQDLIKQMTFDKKQFGYYYSHPEELLWRHWNISYAINWVVKFVKTTEYNFVECGVGQGFTAFFALREAVGNAKISSNFSMHLYDSWKIMRDQDMPKGMKDYWASSYDKLDITITRQNLNEFKNNLIFHNGYIPESLFEEPKAPDTIVYLHIDLNSHKPTLEALKFFYPRAVHGAIMIFDDYGHAGFEETKMVIDEFFHDKPGLLQKLPTGQAIYYHN